MAERMSTKIMPASTLLSLADSEPLLFFALCFDMPYLSKTRLRCHFPWQAGTYVLRERILIDIIILSLPAASGNKENGSFRSRLLIKNLLFFCLDQPFTAPAMKLS